MKILFPGQVDPLAISTVDKTSKVTNDAGFSDYLKKAIAEVDAMQKESDASSMALATGDLDYLHRVMIDAEKAEIALQFTLQVRNKIIDAYQEIMRMQI
ncbi:MAG: Flagellar hook-basal body complex protein FliE [Firmicutes bacterium]|nr:Flagellar hook-basal body complex protein FliE [Bacillota bacterium]MDI6704664.1 flagellar hook-basal body complex protein FliE [Bacillota bacterium]